MKAFLSGQRIMVLIKIRSFINDKFLLLILCYKRIGVTLAEKFEAYSVLF